MFLPNNSQTLSLLSKGLSLALGLNGVSPKGGSVKGTPTLKLENK